MSRRTLLVVIAALALPAASSARDHDDGEWGYIDDVPPDVQVDVNAGSSVTFETFQDNLSPYGEWVSAGSYGRVWRPMRVYSGWRPYYDGSWQWTDEGWLWVSSEPWGWATYHYGRWAFDSYYGWVWVPGYQWAPAWVSWRVGGGYIGWAPLSPGVSVYVTNYPVVYDHWCFVPTTRFVGVPVRTVAYVGGPRVGRIWTATQPAPPRATVSGAPAPAWGGAPRPFVERQVGRPITPVRVQPVASPQAVSAPSRAGVIPVFRPDTARPAPASRGSVSGNVPPRGGAPAPAPGAAPSRPEQGAPGRAAPQGGGTSTWGTSRGDRAPAAPAPGTAPRFEGQGRGGGGAAAPAPGAPPRMEGRQGGGWGGAPAQSRQRAEGMPAPRSAPAPSPSRGGDEARGAPAPASPPRSMAPAPSHGGQARVASRGGGPGGGSHGERGGNGRFGAPPR
jgi:hypothetical protein